MDFCSLPVADKICDAADAIDFVTDPGKAITEGIGNWIAKSSGELAAAAAELAADAVNATTSIDLNAGWFRDNYELLLPIGLVVLVATFCAQLVRAAMKRDGQALSQAFTGTASGVLFAFTAIALTTVAIEVVDALSDGLFRAANTSVEDSVRRMVKVSQIGALSGLGWLVPTFAALGAAAGAFLYWCVMMVRKVGILVLVTLAVFAAAGGGWEATRRWRRGWIEATATLVVSKLVMTVIFLLGASAMGNTDPEDGIAALADVMAGIVIMCLVLLSPYATFKFVHWAAEGTDGESIHRAGGAGAQVARQYTEQAARKAAATAATGGAGAAAGGAAPQGPDVPEFPGDIASTSMPTSGDTGGGGTDQAGQDSASSGGTGGLSPGVDTAVQALEKAVRSATSDRRPGESDPTGAQPGPRATEPAVNTRAPGESLPGTGASSPPPQGAPPAPEDTARPSGPSPTGD
ncbi:MULTISPECIES: SCO6881 family protein [Streptomyces]|uniref:ATP-binding protein n=1 Tax=Streptomyces tsukubensis (strain DSM 42081 / NBRC 108919 / NRRL 18488 / 9993) TaxID=1114943 RepID=I2N7W2_STRT9|nr:ATP-binding protein [Streptomyces tsukubensis]MYS66505.1 ATP-binding protein [Streptomyces sp. SID5473]AZK97053.1 ATP-binding protein [Streptomyces tsukubensis]EIF93109.1 ATP-binding protein [Streptomyces tsukubensis NRRL18488]QKM66974.1 ATP-binding protein [Streptomyces tsukubensis NRRL18488]TAI41549.1 ATP-binding protein [Streptomyces tsukubensis]